MKKIFLATAVIVLCASAHAKFTSGDRQRATQQGAMQANQISSTAQQGNGTTSTNYQSLEQSSKDTMQNSQKGQTTATIMKIGMFAAGAYYASVCPPTNYAACAKAAILFVMGAQAGKSAKSFQAPIDTAWQNSCTYSTLGCNSQTPSNPYNATLTPAQIEQANTNAAAINDNLTKGGFAVDIDSGKIKTPKGELNANDPASVASAIGSDGMAGLMGQVKDIEKDAKAKVDQIKQGAVTAALGFDGGGGGGSVAELGDAGYGSDESVGGAGGGLGSKLDKLRKPAQSKGLTKNFNGDPIGVASDSIFEMMSRRYQLKNTQKTFFGADVQ